MLIRGKQFTIFWQKKTQQQWSIKNIQVSLDDVLSVLFYIYKVPVLVICLLYDKRIGNNRGDKMQFCLNVAVCNMQF
jgi:hypothetical protein